MKNFKQFLKSNIVIFDGAMGTTLQQAGLELGELPERWNVTHPEIIRSVHKDYFDAGANVVCTNTFGANGLKYSDKELENVISFAVENAKWARDNSKGDNKYIALDIGPLGRLLKPYGDLEFEKAVDLFKQVATIGEKCGVDLVLAETFNDSYETKAVVLAVKESTSLPLIVSNAYGEDGKLITGANPCAMVAMLEGLGVDGIGANCSYGAKQLMPVIKELLTYSSTPVLFKPNAGLPVEKDGVTAYECDLEEYAQTLLDAYNLGARMFGGCCGTDNRHIARLFVEFMGKKPVNIPFKPQTLVSSYTHAVEFANSPVLIGERINPTGKKRFKQALAEKDYDYILNEGLTQAEKGVHILDVNVGLPDIDEKAMLCEVVKRLQAVTDLPLQIDTSNVSALEGAMRLYNGKPMVNSVNGKAESMKAVFPLVKKYGGLVVCLTLDENGIPSDAEGRVEIAKKIIKTAKEYGIDKKDLIFDTLTMTVATDVLAPQKTLQAMKTISKDLGCKTILGVSNISFGLPERDVVNGTFFALALENGLSAGIMNPYSYEMLKTYFTFNMLHGHDDNCVDYVKFVSENAREQVAVQTVATAQLNAKSELQNAIIKGMKNKAGEITKALLKTTDGLDIVNNEIIPALNAVGEGFEKKTVYLPALLMSAESAKYAFEEIKANAVSSGEKKEKIVLATVKGDIHDIGKNIVKLLLENYGYKVIDLGKDVAPEKVLEAVREEKAKMVGLSALMTTTVPSMEKTVKLIREHFPDVKIMVGGAVLTEEYARKIGADFYGKDAMATVRYAEKVFGK